MTNSETIAQALREFANLLGEEVKKSETPEDQEKWMELSVLMRRFARLAAAMPFEAAKELVKEFEEEDRSIIMDLLGKKGIFF
jgi:hypothetical protein